VKGRPLKAAAEEVSCHFITQFTARTGCCRRLFRARFLTAYQRSQLSGLPVHAVFHRIRHSVYRCCVSLQVRGVGSQSVVRQVLTVRFISRWCFIFPAVRHFTAHFLSGRRSVYRLRGLRLRVYVLRLHLLHVPGSLSRLARIWCWCLTAGVQVHGCVTGYAVSAVLWCWWWCSRHFVFLAVDGAEKVHRLRWVYFWLWGKTMLRFVGGEMKRREVLIWCFYDVDFYR